MFRAHIIARLVSWIELSGEARHTRSLRLLRCKVHALFFLRRSGAVWRAVLS